MDEGDDLDEEEVETETEDQEWFDSAAAVMMPELILEEGQQENEEVKKVEQSKVKTNLSPNLKKNTKNPKPLQNVSDSKGYKKYLCSHCGRTLGGLTAYKRHLVSRV